MRDGVSSVGAAMAHLPPPLPRIRGRGGTAGGEGGKGEEDRPSPTRKKK